MLYWVCGCGEKFPETGVDNPGDTTGWQQANQHVAEHKQNGEPERIMGLYDEEGNLLFRGASRIQAVKEGILPKKDDTPLMAQGATGAPYTGQATPMRGRVILEDIPIGPMMNMLIQELRLLDPNRYKDDSPQTKRLILEDIATAFAIQNADLLNMGATIKKALIDNEWVKPVATPQ